MGAGIKTDVNKNLKMIDLVRKNELATALKKAGSNGIRTASVVKTDKEGIV